MLGANRLIFALDPKCELDAETLILPSGPKFSCFVVHILFLFRQDLAHFHGQKLKFFTFTVNHESFTFIKQSFFAL